LTQEIAIRPLASGSEFTQAEELQALIWGGGEVEVVPAHFMIALAHNGGLALGAFEGDRLVGVLIGFLGTDSASPERVAMARLKHCSHQLGVHPDYQDRGVGVMLKTAQRGFVLEQGIRLITWTYDPLLSRNAHVNIRRLGAVCRTYLREEYGNMRDAINMGIPSDRFQVDWWITSNRVQTRLSGARRPLDLAHFLSAGAQEVNPASLGEDGLPRPCDAPMRPGGNLALVEIPPDFTALKERDLGLALAWRHHTRKIFESSFAEGYMVTDFIHLAGERHPRSFYALSQAEATLG
jgi:predicted GNAT superfamily acetyltransferase